MPSEKTSVEVVAVTVIPDYVRWFARAAVKGEYDAYESTSSVSGVAIFIPNPLDKRLYPELANATKIMLAFRGSF